MAIPKIKVGGKFLELDLIKLAKKHENKTIEQLKTQIRKRKSTRVTPIDQMVLALKIYQLLNHNQVETAKLFDISRWTIKKWADEYGEVVFAAAPVKEIAVKLAGEIATSQTDVIQDCYRNIRKGLDKLHQAMEVSSGPKSIPNIAEAIRATVEVLKMEHELKGGSSVKGADYFYNIHNMMIKNQYGDED